MRSLRCIVTLSAIVALAAGTAASGGEDWTQFKYDSRHSGNVPERSVATPLGLIGAVPLSDAVFTAPVVAGGRIFAVDGSGTAYCIDGKDLKVIWQRSTRGGAANCNNVSSPAVAGKYLHFGTMAGSYYVLDLADGKVVKEIRCGEPIFSAPVVANGRVYFATLGSRVHALTPDGTVCWKWDFVKHRYGFTGDRWSGEDWLKHKRERVTRAERFECSRDLAAYGNTVVIPTGSAITWLRDAGEKCELRGIYGPMDSYAQHRATFGLSVGEGGETYRQWHELDNGGQVEILRDEKVETEYVKKMWNGDVVPGTKTGTAGSLMGFCSVSIRGQDVYRTRPEEGFGLCRHTRGKPEEPLGGYPSIASPVLLKDQAVFGGLDGAMHVVPLAGGGKGWSFPTPFGKAISAPAAVADGRVIFGCEDGYLYVLGPGGAAPAPAKDLELWKVRSPLTGRLTDPKYDWFTSFADFGSTNANSQGVKPPFKINWIRRYEGTTKHASTCGGGRMYTHMAEGQIFAVEQETGRLLWRRYWPGVRISYTAPLYYRERVIVPQTGIGRCRLRCLDAATGRLLWEAPFSGSAGWTRQLPPMVHDNLVIYMFGTGKYGAGQAESWLFPAWNRKSFPADHKPLVRAWDLETGKEVWTKDFSEYGAGGDEGALCMMDGMLFYTCYFGDAPPDRGGKPAPGGVTAAMDPATGKVIWVSTEQYTRGACTISARDGRLYLGGRNPFSRADRYSRVACLDAKDGRLIWKSDPVSSIRIVTVTDRFLHAHASKQRGYLIDKATGKVLSDPTGYYKCTKFSYSEPYLFAINLDVWDLSKEARLIASGPAMDTCECVSGFISNGRYFYTAHGAGMQVGRVCGPEAEAFTPVWTAREVSE